jgi:flagellar hook-length control protein FliK
MSAEGSRLSPAGTAPGERAPGLFDARASKKAGKKGFFSSILSRLRTTEASAGAESGRIGFRPKAQTEGKDASVRDALPAEAESARKGAKPRASADTPVRLKDSQDWRKRDRSSRFADPPDIAVQGSASAVQGFRAAKGRNDRADASVKAEESDPRDNAKKSPKSDKLKFDVYDRRTRKDAVAEKTGETKPDPATEPGRKGGDGSKDILVELREGRTSPEGQGSHRAEGSGKADSFASRLAERLQDTYNAEIVRQGSLVLRDGGSGTIRLFLQPESLGNVKVRLELADNSIKGSIVVESEEARDAFQADIERLTKDFIDSGFQDAKLEVSVDSGAGGRNGTGADGAPGYLSPRGGMAGAFEAMDAGSGGFAAALTPGTVDILV